MKPKFESLIVTAEKIGRRLASFEWLAALLMRLFVGYFFLETGWAKLHNLDAFTARFVQWGIPHAAFNAALSAYTECIGGALTVAGLGMRFVSIPMIINMVVAVVSVKMKNVAGLDDFVELDEPLVRISLFLVDDFGRGVDKPGPPDVFGHHSPIKTQQRRLIDSLGTERRLRRVKPLSRGIAY